jgi:hypothetical protein
MAGPWETGNYQPQDHPIPFMGIYPNNASFSHRDTCLTVFIVVLLVTQKNWKQPRCPSTFEWIRTHGILLSCSKKYEIVNFGDKKMELEKEIILS